MIKIGKIYRHYKGNLYKVLVIATHSETQEDMVVYEDINFPNKTWVRPVKMFEENVIVNGESVPRFKGE